MTIKEHIQGKARFEYYRAGHLYYRTEHTNFLFPVPIEDCGEATFPAEEKGITLMRYIRKHMGTLAAGNDIPSVE